MDQVCLARIPPRLHSAPWRRQETRHDIMGPISAVESGKVVFEVKDAIDNQVLGPL
jgi:hypothetical protein